VGRGDTGFSYQPALDGVRGLAVAFVLAFHLGLPWASGGYLGVSVFFTLSGFLITSLLLRERTLTGRVKLKAFYVRRARRLLPAAIICTAAICVLFATHVFIERSGTNADVLSALFDFANWHALLAHRSYADLFTSPSPFAHFWSLAIEEQFYFLWPLVLPLLAAWAATRRVGLPRHAKQSRLPAPGRFRPSLPVVLIAMFIAFALAAPLTASLWSSDAAYYASWARFSEILAGAALAAFVAERDHLPSRLRLLAPIGLVAVIVACVITPSSDGWAYHGGLPLFAIASAMLLAGLQVAGPVRRALSVRPLVRLGVISYGVYLFHWPVFLVLDEDRTGLHGIALDVVRVAVTLVIAHVVYEAIEHPIRVGEVLAGARRYVSIVAASIVTVALVSLVAVNDVPVTHGPRQTVLGGAEPIPISVVHEFAPAPVGTYAQAIAASVAPPPPPHPLTVAVFGDSVPDWLLRDAAPSYTRTDVVVVNAAHEACDAAVGEPPMRGRHGEHFKVPDDCQSWPDSYPPVVTDPTRPVDVALLALGQAPMLDRQIDGKWVSPCQTMDWYVKDVSQRIDYLKTKVHQVVLALPSWGGKKITWFLPDDNAARYACVRTQLSDLAATEHIKTIDLADVLCPNGPDGACNDDRSQDGLHVDPDAAPKVLDWVVDQIKAVHAASKPHGHIY
jgi:peptidoglycan/LPS O-acetylase OafA/YrhL